MKKTLVKITFVCLFVFLFCINNVNATETVCNYSGEKNGEIITTSVKFSAQSQVYWDGVLQFVNQGVSNQIRFFNIGEVWNGGFDNYKDYYPDYGVETLVEYYDQSGGCPSYVLVFSADASSDSTQKIGVLASTTEIKKNGMKVSEKAIIAILTITNPEDDETAEEPVPEEEKPILCSYNINIESDIKKEEYLIDLTIDKSKRKINSSESKVVGDFDSFYKTVSGDCPTSYYACAELGLNNNGKHDIYIAPNKDIMLEKIFNAALITETNKDEFCEGMSIDECITEFEDIYGFSCKDSNYIENNSLILGDGGCGAFTKYIKNIKNNPDNSKNTINDLKTWCKAIVQYSNYTHDTSSCIYKCLNIDKYLPEIEKNELGECGFSKRLISWGLNIMKWIKYIVPVFVIIFGIFDFIKAIGADKEDEMKKSQKKFITRLIAAALIFIIPFILEFVLDKFGFTEYIDGCEVIQELD